jgi:hypothetical protein
MASQFPCSYGYLKATCRIHRFAINLLNLVSKFVGCQHLISSCRLSTERNTNLELISFFETCRIELTVNLKRFEQINVGTSCF